MVANTNLPNKNKCPSASVSSIDSSKSVASSSTSPKPTKRLTNTRPKLIRKKSYSFDLDTRRHSSTYQTPQLQENQSRLVDLIKNIWHENHLSFDTLELWDSLKRIQWDMRWVTKPYLKLVLTSVNTVLIAIQEWVTSFQILYNTVQWVILIQHIQHTFHHPILQIVLAMIA